MLRFAPISRPLWPPFSSPFPIRNTRSGRLQREDRVRREGAANSIVVDRSAIQRILSVPHPRPLFSLHTHAISQLKEPNEFLLEFLFVTFVPFVVTFQHPRFPHDSEESGRVTTAEE